jgi:DNA-binding NtrC family response regulator
MSAQLKEMQRTIRQSERTRLLAQLASGLAHQLLEHCGGNRAAAALMLGIHRATLRQKLRKYGVDRSSSLKGKPAVGSV